MDEDEPEPQQGRNDGADPFSAVEAKGEEDEDEEPNALLYVECVSWLARSGLTLCTENSTYSGDSRMRRRTRRSGRKNANVAMLPVRLWKTSMKKSSANCLLASNPTSPFVALSCAIIQCQWVCRSKEEEKHKEMASALEGESWQRVDSLVSFCQNSMW